MNKIKFTFVCLFHLIIIISALNIPQPECSSREVYLNCGPSCPQTCEWLNKPCTLMASSQCNPGCYCKKGYVRENNKCVRAKKVCCSENEDYMLACPSCEKTCSNLSDDCTETTEIPGCYCTDGYVRNEATGTCIPESDCAAFSCNKNEIYLECGPKCPQTCEFLFKNCTIHSDLCRPGCYCTYGYVRINGECVPGNTVCCLDNEVLKYSHPSCERSCDYPQYKKCEMQIDEEKGCYCIDGYVRNKDGNCVSPSDCRVSKCNSSLEVYDPCTETCTKTCTNPSGLGDCKKGIAECVCIYGYVRDEHQNCIHPLKCPKNYSGEQRCGKREHYSECEIDNMCNKADMSTTCCAGCFCNDGYARDSDGDCVKKIYC